MIFATLNRRLILSHLGVALLVALSLYTVASRANLSAAEEQGHNRLEDLGFTASNALEDVLHKYEEGEVALSSVNATLAHWLSDEPDLHYTLFLPDGVPIADNRLSSPSTATSLTAPEVQLALESDRGEGDVVRESEAGGLYLYVAVRVEHEDHVMGILRLGLPYDLVLAPARRANRMLLVFLGGLLLLVGVGGALLARSLTRPIRSLTHSAEQIASGDLSARATPSGPPELRRLAITFNRMADRLEEHVNNLQDFVANASHELRTPLTTIKLRVEALLKGAWNEPAIAQRFLHDVDHEIDRLTFMVNELLDLSRIEAGAGQGDYAPVNLGVIVEETCEMFRVRAQKHGVTLAHHVDKDLPPVLGNEEQLRRVLDNLISNALNHTPAGGEVHLFVEASEEPGQLQIRVSDTGRGIEARHLPHIFKRFYRVEQTRPLDGRPGGTGLGLAIVRTIVEAHNGKIRVHSEVGKGTTFIIDLPLTP